MIPSPIRKHRAILLCFLIFKFRRRTMGKAAQMKSVRKENAATRFQSATRPSTSDLFVARY